MNCRRIAAFFCLLTCVQVHCLRSAHAAVLPPNVLKSNNGPSIEPQVTAFVNKHAPDLGSTNPDARRAAREALISEISGANNAPVPSEEFLEVYANALNKALEPLAANQDVRVRLNVAVSAANVAVNTKNTGLIPVVVKLLGDESEAVVLWAAKASKFLVQPQLRAKPENEPLLPALMAAARKYVASGPMAQTIYDALRDDEAILAPPPNWAAIAPTMVDNLQKFLGMRLELYKKGIPQEPKSEADAIYFLTAEKIWEAQTPEQKLQTVQLSSDLISLASYRLTNANSLQKQELLVVMSRTGRGLQVVGDWMNQPNLMAAAALPTAALGAMSTADAIDRAVASVYPNLIRIPGFEKLKPPPEPETGE